MLNPLNFLSKIIKSSNQKELDKLKKTVKKINDLEDQIRKLEDKSFPQKTKNLIEKIENQVSLDKILPEAFAFLVLINKALIFFLLIFKFHFIFSEINFDCV